MYSREGMDGANLESGTKKLTVWLLVRGIKSFVVAVIVNVCDVPAVSELVSNKKLQPTFGQPGAF
jgi:hypothetical protein